MRDDIGKIEIITREDCTFCHKAKEILRHNNVEFAEKYIGLDIARDEVLETYPECKVLPVVVVDGVCIGGYTDLLDYLFPALEIEPENDDEDQG
jgi:glutaredoxin